MVTLDPYQSECPDNDLKVPGGFFAVRHTEGRNAPTHSCPPLKSLKIQVPQYEGTDSSAVTDESTLSSPHSLMDGTEEARWIVCKANESMREITPWDIGAGREEDKSVGGDDERLLHASSVLSSTASCILKSPTDNDEDNILDSYPDITSNSNTQKKPELSRLIGKMNISDDAPLDRLEDPATPPPTQFEARKKQLFSPSPPPRSPCRSPASPVYTPQLNISKIREHFDEDALPNIMCFQALSMAANYHPSSSSPPPSSIVIPMPTSSSRRHTTDGTKSRFIAAANRCPSFTMPEQRQQINPDVRPTSSSSRLKSAFQKLRGQSGAGADKQPSSKRGHNTVAPEPIDSFKEACPPFPVMTRPTKSSSFAERIKAKFQRKSSNKEGSNGLSRSTSLTSIAWPRRSDNKRPSSASTVVAAPPFVKPLKGILRGNKVNYYYVKEANLRDNRGTTRSER